MADGNLELRVKVEPHIHRCVHQLVKKVYEETGVIIDSIELDWSVIDTVNGSHATLNEVNIMTTTKGD